MNPRGQLKPPTDTDGHGSEADTKNSEISRRLKSPHWRNPHCNRPGSSLAAKKSERGSVSRSSCVTEAGLENCGASHRFGAAAGRRPALRFGCGFAALCPTVSISGFASLHKIQLPDQE